MVAKQRARDGAGVGGGCDALRDAIADAMAQVDGLPERVAQDDAVMDGLADAVLGVVVARDAERLAAIEAQQRYTVRPGVDPMRPYLSASEGGEALLRADVLAILRGTTDA